MTEAGPNVSERPPIPSEVPYTSEEAAAIEDFFRNMTGRYRSRYRLGPNGTLQIFSKEDTLAQTLQLKAYRPITTEERDAMEEQRLEDLAALDTLFEKKRTALREALTNYKATGEIEPVLVANQEVEDIELQRVLVRTPVRTVSQIDIPVASQVLFHEPYEKRKLFGTYNLFAKFDPPTGSTESKYADPLEGGIFRLERRSFHPSLFYGRYEEVGTRVAAEAEAVVEESGKGRVRLDGGGFARLIDDADDEHNGFLSPGFPVEFIYKETKYSSAFQAYEAERMRQTNQERVRTALLKTRSVRTIRTLTRKVSENVKNPRAVWTEILTALYIQHPELAEQLKATGTDTLVYADPLGGVGLSRDDKKILSPAQWPSENIVGSVLEVIRARLREKPAEEAAPAGGAKESVISVDEQKKARVGAIINARRY
jgi:predicted NAD-dependent protein-ADP-ribosyltransferase YbiA (DUF1768 family)